MGFNRPFRIAGDLTDLFSVLPTTPYLNRLAGTIRVADFRPSGMLPSGDDRGLWVLGLRSARADRGPGPVIAS